MQEKISKERLKIKEFLQQYHEKIKHDEELKQKEEEELKRKEEEEIKKNILLNKPRIEFRKELYNQKLKEKKLKEEELIEKEKQQLLFLQKLAEGVPYIQAIRDAKPRLMDLTTAVKGHQFVSHQEFSRGHMPLQGFTTNDIVNDARFRLACALREAGLAGSEAARSAVEAFHPRPQLAIHGIL